MLTIQTKPDCTLGFALGWKGLDGRFTFQLNQDIEFPANVIGKLSEVTEEQARELIDSSIGILMFQKDGTKVFTPRPCLVELKLAAEGVGIKEKDFDKYLVIKL